MFSGDIPRIDATGYKGDMAQLTIIPKSILLLEFSVLEPGDCIYSTSHIKSIP